MATTLRISEMMLEEADLTDDAEFEQYLLDAERGNPSDFRALQDSLPSYVQTALWEGTVVTHCACDYGADGTLQHNGGIAVTVSHEEQFYDLIVGWEKTLTIGAPANLTNDALYRCTETGRFLVWPSQVSMEFEGDCNYSDLECDGGD